MKILIVEDSRTQAEYLRHILEKEGYRVAMAPNGRAALEAVAADRPAVILTDIVMPEMDGYDLCRRIKQDAATRNIPVVLVTHLSDPADVMRGLEAGADSFIIKPCAADLVRSRLESILGTADRAGSDGTGPGMEVFFAGRMYTLSAGRRQILNTLLSTYEIAVGKNVELQEAQERLNAVNRELQRAVADLERANDDLSQENAERRRVEKALSEANKKLQLMASISRHDLLNLLMAMDGYLALAQGSRDSDPETSWKFVANARDAVDRMTRTIRFAAEYQEIGAASPVWHEIRDIVERSRMYTPLGTVALENAVPAGVEVYADPLIEKVFVNLIENAVRYGETITAIRFSLEEAGGVARIVCEDNGAGVPEGEKERIFAYGSGKNTGLGLFLAREVLAITGMTIRETGSPGGGARFEIACPAEAIRTAGKREA